MFARRRNACIESTRISSFFIIKERKASKREIWLLEKIQKQLSANVLVYIYRKLLVVESYYSKVVVLKPATLREGIIIGCYWRVLRENILKNIYVARMNIIFYMHAFSAESCLQNE